MVNFLVSLMKPRLQIYNFTNKHISVTLLCNFKEQKFFKSTYKMNRYFKVQVKTLKVTTCTVCYSAMCKGKFKG